MTRKRSRAHFFLARTVLNLPGERSALSGVLFLKSEHGGRTKKENGTGENRSQVLVACSVRGYLISAHDEPM